MSPQTKTRAAIAMLVYLMTNAVLFGAGLIIALMASRSGLWIPVVAIASLVLAAPLAWEIAPRLRARNHSHLHYQPVTLRTQSRLYRR